MLLACDDITLASIVYDRHSCLSRGLSLTSRARYGLRLLANQITRSRRNITAVTTTALIRNQLGPRIHRNTGTDV